MPARRRASSTRDAISRLKMWDRKMNADVYAEYLKATKPLAIPKIAGYQTTHEYLISMVKSILQDYPEEYPILQEYMWYAQKLWKLTQTYHSEALKKEANAIFLSYLARATSVVVAHGLAKTPNKVLVTPRGNVGAVWVYARDETNVTINCERAPTTDIVVDWYAEV